MNWSQKDKVAFSAQTEIGELFSGAVDTGLKVEPWMPQLETVGHYLVEVLGRDKCSEISLSYQEFSDLNRAMHVVASVFTSGSFRFEGVFDNMIEPFERLVGYFFGEVGPWTFGVVHEIEHQARSNEGLKQTFCFSNPRIVSSFAYKQPMAKTQEQIKRVFDSHIKTLNVPFATLQGGDLGAWAKAIAEDGTMELSVD